MNEEESIIIDHFNENNDLSSTRVNIELEKMNQVIEGKDINTMFSNSTSLWQNGYLLGYYEAMRRYTKQAKELQKQKMDQE